MNAENLRQGTRVIVTYTSGKEVRGKVVKLAEGGVVVKVVGSCMWGRWFPWSQVRRDA